MGGMALNGEPMRRALPKRTPSSDEARTRIEAGITDLRLRSLNEVQKTYTRPLGPTTGIGPKLSCLLEYSMRAEPRWAPPSMERAIQMSLLSLCQRVQTTKICDGPRRSLSTVIKGLSSAELTSTTTS